MPLALDDPNKLALLTKAGADIRYLLRFEAADRQHRCCLIAEAFMIYGPQRFWLSVLAAFMPATAVIAIAIPVNACIAPIIALTPLTPTPFTS
jgi:hypothetical protein